MTNSKRIAGLIGPVLVAVAVSESINLRLLLSTPAPILVVYLAGTLLFLAGIAIVRDHSRWTGGWPVLVTLTGWLAVVGGLIRMFAPVFVQREAQNTTVAYALLVAVFAVGAFLTFKAYSRERGKTASA
jgi:hypothetical protein